MSIIQRPSKEGNATTYQGKVAAGYTKILASEVDADIDTMYAAWNGGVDTVNIKPGAVTAPCLASGAVTGSALAPGSITNAALAAGSVTSATIADGTIVASDLAPGTVETISGWVWDTGNVVHLHDETKLVGVGTDAPIAKFHVQGQPTDTYTTAVVQNLNPTGANAGLRLMVPGADATWYVDRASGEFGVYTTATGAPVFHCAPSTGYLQQQHVDIGWNRAVGGILDDTYVIAGANTTNPFVIKQWSFAEWSPMGRCYRIRVYGTIGVQGGSFVEMSLLLGSTTIMYWNAAAPGWTLAYYEVDADIITDVPNGTCTWGAKLTQTLQASTQPTATQATPWIVRGNGALPATPLIGLQGRFGTAAAANSMDRFTAILQAL